LIEFAFGRVPARLKTTVNEKKILLKRLVKKYLPPTFDLKRKQGFSIPLKNWLKKGPFRDLFYDILLSDNCVLNKRAVCNLLEKQDMGFSNQERLYGLVLFELWRREYHVGL
jgi:asparagine synthase (glutamine-hydrolysing)